MATDANVTVQPLVTKTATFNGPALNLKGGTPRRGLFIRVLYKNASNASGSNTVTFQVDVSADNSTWYGKTVDNEHVVTLSTTVQSGEIWIPIETSDPYIRLTATVAGAGSTPTIDYQGDLVLGRPA